LDSCQETLKADFDELKLTYENLQVKLQEKDAQIHALQQDLD
jgi:prefoldin subunit 5